MIMSDENIKQLLAKGVESVAQAIIDSPEPLPSTGYRVWGNDGTAGNNQLIGQQWYWLASVVVSRDKDMIDNLKA